MKNKIILIGFATLLMVILLVSVVSATEDISSSNTISDKKIAFWYGKVNMHFSGDTGWVTDSDGSAGAGEYSQWGEDGWIDRKLEYCQRFWPETVAVEEAGYANITGWRNAGNTGGPYTSVKITYSCVQEDNNENTHRTCFDTDGKNYFKKGSTSIIYATEDGSIPYQNPNDEQFEKTYYDTCQYESPVGGSSDSVISNVVEYYCDGTVVEKQTVRCKFGCEDGACINEPISNEKVCCKTTSPVASTNNNPYSYNFRYKSDCIEQPELGNYNKIVDNKFCEPEYDEEICCKILQPVASSTEGNQYTYEFRHRDKCVSPMASVRSNQIVADKYCKPIVEEPKMYCKDTDGKSAVRKGTVTFSYNGEVSTYTDQCFEGNDKTMIAESQSGVVEYYCDHNEVAKQVIPCAKGCEDGACKTANNDFDLTCPVGCEVFSEEDKTCLCPMIKIKSRDGYMVIDSADEEIVAKKITINPGANSLRAQSETGEVEVGSNNLNKGGIELPSNSNGKDRNVMVSTDDQLWNHIEDEANVKAKTRKPIVTKEDKLWLETDTGDQEVKILPAVASETAKQVVSSNHGEPILKEEGNKLVYSFEEERKVKVLGFIPANAKYGATVDAQTGELISEERPWFKEFIFK